MKCNLLHGNLFWKNQHSHDRSQVKLVYLYYKEFSRGIISFYCRNWLTQSWIPRIPSIICMANKCWRMKKAGDVIHHWVEKPKVGTRAACHSDLHSRIGKLENQYVWDIRRPMWILKQKLVLGCFVLFGSSLYWLMPLFLNRNHFCSLVHSCEC